MANIRIFVLLLVLLIIVNCALIRTTNADESKHREKRLFRCAKTGKKCGGFLGKSCCSNLVCHKLSRKCVRKGTPFSWVAKRNGK